MPLTRRNYSHLPQPVGPYVHAVHSNGLLFLSGLTAFGSPQQGRRMPEQADAIFDQIESIARAEGATIASLVKVTIFVTALSDISDLRETLFRRYEQHLPASSLVQVAALFSPDISIEVEAVLAID